MCSVDPGWSSYEGTASQVENFYASGQTLPLDFEDGAARIVDPIFQGLQGKAIYGVLLKDFRVVEW